MSYQRVSLEHQCNPNKADVVVGRPNKHVGAVFDLGFRTSQELMIDHKFNSHYSTSS